MEAHKPNRYVCGVYIRQTEVWLGEFEASGKELYDYALNDVQTVEEYEMVINMCITQQIYEQWWERLKASIPKRLPKPK